MLDLNKDCYYTILSSISYLYQDLEKYKKAETYLIEKETLIKKNFGKNTLEYSHPIYYVNY